MTMEVLKFNKLNTTTMVAVNSSTDTVSYLFNNNTTLGYSTDGYPSDTSTDILISFSSSVVLSHVLIQNHNLKSFSVFYNGTTTNSLFSTTTNSVTSHYISTASVTVSSVTLRMNESISGADEKSVGELVLSEKHFQFERNPSIGDYNYTTYRKQIRHEMPDGGTVVHTIRDKFRADLAWEFITDDFYSNLSYLFNLAEDFYFLPFPTSTSWDGLAYDVVWVGGFNFKYGSNVKATGFSGSLKIEETPSQ